MFADAPDSTFDQVETMQWNEPVLEAHQSWLHSKSARGLPTLWVLLYKRAEQMQLPALKQDPPQTISTCLTPQRDRFESSTSEKWIILNTGVVSVQLSSLNHSDQTQ